MNSENANLSSLVRARGQIRRLFTRSLLNIDTEADYTHVQELHEKLNRFDELIQFRLLQEEAKDDVVEKEYDECDLYCKQWYAARNCYNVKKDTETTIATSKPMKRNINLPKIELNKFNDDPKRWLPFWSQFRKIHNDETLENSDKFQYLIQAMEEGSSARSLVESYPPTSENYEKVVQFLTERFARQDILVETYIRELLTLVISKNNHTVSSIYDRLMSITQTLESLGITEQKYECILYPLVESALSDNTLLAWSRVPQGNTTESKLSLLFRFLKNEVEAEGRLQMARSDILGRESSNPSIPTANCLLTKEHVEKKKENYNTEGKLNCYFCDKAHNSVECSKANSLKLDDKKEAIKKKGGCFICLKQGHLAKYCKSFIKCLNCGKRHLVILCPELHSTQMQSAPKTESKEVVNSLSCNNTTTILQTLVVQISSHSGKEKKVRALLDSGSQRTYIKTGLADELGLEVTGSERLGHSLFGGVKKQSEVHKLIKFKVSSLDNKYETTIIGLENNILCGYLPKVRDPALIKNLQTKGVTLTDTMENVSDISILIGSDFLGSILENEMIRMTDNLIAWKTKLGWTIQGPMQGVYSTIVNTHFVATPQEDSTLEFLWDLETLGIKEPYNNKENDICLEISVNDCGRYEVPLLWKDGYPMLESNYEAAQRRLHSTTKKLCNIGRLEDYHEIIKEWETEGIIEIVETEGEQGHYLPHHAVIKLESTTTKIRPVFDASSKDKNGLSLNMCIEKGTNLMEIIPKLITMFRAGMYGVISDIKKAFLQISIAPEDRKYLKLLWWNNPHTRDKVLVYQHARVPFGVACSPFLLAKTIIQHLEQHVDIYPETVVRLKESFYVDNCVTSFDTKEEVEKFIKEPTELMNKGKFDLRGWMTNTNQKEELVSVLGVQWDRNMDNLRCNLNLKPVPNSISKRNLLSITQQIFDPIGMLCPVTLIPKLIIQKAWQLKTGWDEMISAQLEKEYKDWIHTIDCLNECRIPRKLTEFPLHKCKTTVHIFCDASKDAYAGCIFLRTEYEEQVTVRLIIAKSRVAPIKRQMTLPRLELMGALIASRLYLEVVTSGLLSACKNYKVYCWTDSAVVLAWLQRQETWKTFVTNRIKEICTNTDKNDWNHLPGVYNPADLPSRGCTPKSLLETQWWTGPEWLYLEEQYWPKSKVNCSGKEEEAISSEKNKNVAVNVEIILENFSNNLLYFNQYSKIVRLVARLLRLSPRIREEYNVTTVHIGSEEYKNAEITLIKLLQKESYKESNQDKKLLTIEEGEIIKVKTRLQYSGEENDFVYPILLPGKNEIVLRMIQERHRHMNHAGTQTLMATLRNTYWITGVRNVVKNVVTKCIICKRYKVKNYTVPEPPLPADRIRTTAPFEITGIDLAGPLFLKNNQKCWIVLFTCAVYRAVHLELTESLSTHSFLMALRRFIARRGKTRIIYSDNGTNFVGAANLLRQIDWQEIEEATSMYQIQWKFSVPTAPWWGGWWERLIRVVKDMLRRILGKASIDWIELSTILCDCEVVINSRPLTYVEMGDVKPLTPMLFLQSLPTGEIPDLDQIDEKSIQVRYKYLQQLRLDFRKRFKSEYLSLLISKGKESIREPKVGELVLIDNDTSRLHWPVGIITEVYTGKDNLSRVARVQTASGIKVRPYQRLYPLELSVVSQDWLESIPASRPADHQQTGNIENAIAPIPLASTTRSGRTIKMPWRFME